MKRKLFAWIVLISFVLSTVGTRAAHAQDETPPRYRHPELIPPSLSHPPTGFAKSQGDMGASVDMGMGVRIPSVASAAKPQNNLSPMIVGAPGLSFRYLHEFGINSEPYLVDSAHLNSPTGIFIDGSGNLFVAEERGDRMLKFDSADVNTLTLGQAGIPWAHDTYIGNPHDVVTDAGGNIWVLINTALKKFDSTGGFLESFPYNNPWESGTDNNHFNSDPQGLAFGPGGYLYVSDSNNHRIQILNTSYVDPDPVTNPFTVAYVATIGTGNRETSNAGFSYPTRIAFDSAGNLYVMDSDNFRVQRCASAGPADPVTNPWVCTTFFGETGVWGSDLTHIDWATGIAIDTKGTVPNESDDVIYIADGNNYRVLECSSAATCAVFAGVTIEDGSDNARFAFPSDVALDLAGHVYVSDTDNFRIQKFTTAGVYQSTLGVTGVPYLTNAAHIYDPQGVAVAPDGSIYVTEGNGNRLLKFNAVGVQQWTVGVPGIGGSDIFHLGRGGGDGPQGNPAVDSSGRVYVTDPANNRVQIFNPDGTYYATLGGNWGFGTYKFRCMGGVAISPVNDDILVVDRCNQRVQVYDSARVYKATLGTTNVSGADDTHFSNPWGVAVDSLGNIYVGDSDNYRVQKCTLSGGCSTFVGETGVQGSDYYHFQHPEQVAVDALNRVYVSDAWNQRVRVYDTAGAYLTTIGGGWGPETGNMTSSRGLAVDAAGSLYVADGDTHRIQKFARGTPNWQQVNVNGFGDISNGFVMSLAEFNGKLYAGTEQDYTGGQIWELNGTTWTAVMSNGFGDPFNIGIDHMLAYGGYLYASTANYDPLTWASTNGGQLWRSPDGTTWSNVTPAAMDSASNAEIMRLVEFNGSLYFSTWAFGSPPAHGGEIWRCTICDNTDWTQIDSNGFGDGGNGTAVSFASFGGVLYAGTWNVDTGGEIWRSASGNSGDWTQVNADGFGDSGNTAISSLSAFGSYLYAATSHVGGAGTQVWRSNNGITWAKVVDNGFGNPDFRRIPALKQLGGSLYLVIGNNSDGLGVWRTLNGINWIPSATGGFGNRNNSSTYWGNSVTTLGTSLYIGTRNWNNGAQIWKTNTNQQIYTATLQSIDAQDGWILESSELSNAGGTMNIVAPTFNLGDDAARRQYRSFLSFGTGVALPDTAVITKVTLKFQKQGIVGGGNPVTAFQGIYAEIKKGYFGAAPALALTDFNLAGNKIVGAVKPNPFGNWYSIDLTSGNSAINKLATLSGLTQIRLRFKLDDNNNAIANYLSLYSGHAAPASRPQLIIEYYVP